MVINYGSWMATTVKGVTPDITDHCLSLPASILPKPNADFDGDIMNVKIHKLDNIADKYYKELNPRSNMCISRNDGMFDPDACIYKDQLIGLFAFANYNED